MKFIPIMRFPYCTSQTSELFKFIERVFTLYSIRILGYLSNVTVKAGDQIEGGD